MIIGILLEKENKRLEIELAKEKGWWDKWMNEEKKEVKKLVDSLDKTFLDTVIKQTILKHELPLKVLFFYRLFDTHTNNEDFHWAKIYKTLVKKVSEYYKNQ